MDNNPKQKPRIELVPGYLKREPIVRINFKYNREIIATIKTATGIFQETILISQYSFPDYRPWQK